MQYDILDFIDSGTLREMLRGKYLEPAVECILIAQCRKKSMKDKLSAIQERHQTYSPAKFQEGVYHLPDFDDISKAVGLYIGKMEDALKLTEIADAGHVFQVEPGFASQQSIFRSFSEAVYDLRYRNFEHKEISRRTIDSSDDPVYFYALNEDYQVSGIRISSYTDSEQIWNIEYAFAEIPHDYNVGDIVQYRNKYYTIVNMEHATRKTRWLNFSDYGDMSLNCFGYYPDEMHSCGGSYGHAHIRILRTERAKPDDLPEEMKPLLALSLLLKGKMRITDFLESYSNRALPDLMEYYERK